MLRFFNISMHLLHGSHAQVSVPAQGVVWDSQRGFGSDYTPPYVIHPTIRSQTL